MSALRKSKRGTEKAKENNYLGPEWSRRRKATRGVSALISSLSLALGPRGTQHTLSISLCAQCLFAADDQRELAFPATFATRAAQIFGCCTHTYVRRKAAFAFPCRARGAVIWLFAGRRPKGWRAEEIWTPTLAKRVAPGNSRHFDNENNSSGMKYIARRFFPRN